MANQIKFLQGTFEQYNAIAKDPNALYFITDTYQLYRGDKAYGKSYEAVSALPAVSAGKQDIIYVNTSDKNIYIFNGTSFSSILSPAEILTTVSQSDDAHAVSSKAIYTFVIEKVAEAVGGSTSLVSDVKASTTAGCIAVLKSGAEQDYADVAVKGVVTNPTYVADTRTITMPVEGGTSLVINLGKDMVISSGVYNTDTKELELSIANTDPVQIVKIPVGSLVDVYTSGSAAEDTVSIVVTADNTIKSTIKVDTTSKLSVKSTGELTIDLTAYALTSAVTALTTRIDDIETDIASLVAADIKTLADAKDYADTIQTALITTIGTAKTEAINTSRAYTDSIVATSLTWNPIA